MAQTTTETATATALGQAEGTATRHSAQNVRYKMKYNASTGKWEQEQIMTPLVQTIYPGIRTKEGKTKDISTGLVSDPLPTIGPVSNIPEPEVTPLPVVTDGTPTTGGGGYQETQQQYQRPTPTTTGGIKYEEGQISGVSESQQDRMKYNVMPGGLNFRSGAQNLSLSQSHGLIEDLVNPTVKTEEEITAQKKKLSMFGTMGAVAGFLGTAVQPRSEKIQIRKMIESGALQVREGDNLLSNKEAIRRLTQDENGRLKILKGQDLINSGLKVSQVKHLSKDYANSAAFMNFQEDKASNFSTSGSSTPWGKVISEGVQLTTLNPVMGSAGTTLFGILKRKDGIALGASDTNGEKVLVTEYGNGGAYRSDGKFVGMNGQIYAFGSAGNAKEAAEKGLLSDVVLKRMTDENGFLKSLYTDPDSEFFIGGNVVNGKYVGNRVLEENRDIVDNVGNVVGTSAPDDSNDKRTFDEERKLDVTPTPTTGMTREEAAAKVEAPIREKYDTSGRGGVQEPKEEKKSYEKKEERKTCFHPEQLIGNKFMKDLQPGDFINRIEILGMVKLKLNEDMYSINDVKVTGSHKVKFNNNWIFVSEHSDSIKINDKPEFVYVPIVEGGTFILNGNEFADYDDEHIETLNNKLKKRKAA